MVSGELGPSRRELLRRGVLLTGALAVGTGLEHNVRGLATGSGSSFRMPLRFPPVITDDDITISMRAALVPLKPGPRTRMWTFGGSFPGPMIRRPSGHPTRVTFVHELPSAVQDLTIHLHGGHNRTRYDGQPDRFVIKPGQRGTYVYDFVEGGAPERAALRWYHDHSHMRTLRNVYRGLAGMIIIDDGFDRRLGLPSGPYDLPLFVTNRVLDEQNQLVDPLLGTQNPPGDDIPDLSGDNFVNGVFKPYLDVEPRPYRFRILSAPSFRPYNLRLSSGDPFHLIGSDGGLLPERAEASALPLGPAERADVVIDFSRAAGKQITLASVSASSPTGIPRTDPISAPLMQFRVRKGQPKRLATPSKLRPLPAWVDALSQQPQRVWVFGLGVDPAGSTAWTINGRTFDPSRVDAQPIVNTTETWMFVNATSGATSHYVHVHDVPFKILSRNGAAPTGAETGLKDTFRLDPGEVVVAGSRFSDNTGVFMIHCHMLNHEDHGMMTTFEVVGSGSPPKSADPAALLRASIDDGVHRRDARRIIREAVGGRPASTSGDSFVYTTAMCEPK